MAGCNWRKHYEFIVNNKLYIYPNIILNNKGYPKFKDAFDWLLLQLPDCKCRVCNCSMKLRSNYIKSEYNDYTKFDSTMDKVCSSN